MLTNTVTMLEKHIFSFPIFRCHLPKAVVTSSSYSIKS